MASAIQHSESAEHVAIASDGDLVAVRKQVRLMAVEIGFGITDVTRIVTAASELARNILRFADHGHMTLKCLDSSNGPGLELIFTDQGPGIEDLEQAFGEGFTTGGGLGLGLPGTRRLMDEMDVQTESGKGTIIRIAKWLKKRSHAA